MVEGQRARETPSVPHRGSDVNIPKLLYLAPISSLTFSVSDFFSPAGLVPLFLLAIFSARLRASIRSFLLFPYSS
jgi:hypothetical protein